MCESPLLAVYCSSPENGRAVSAFKVCLFYRPHWGVEQTRAQRREVPGARSRSVLSLPFFILYIYIYATVRCAGGERSS